MSRIYASPFRVYLCLAALALAGIYSGLKLPVSLFPNSSKPKINVNLYYGSITSEEFLNSYGRSLEDQLREVTRGKVELESLHANYERNNVTYELDFKWGTSSLDAVKEVELIAHSFSGRLPEDIRDSISVNMNKGDGGFLAISFYSPKRSLDELYDLLEPVLIPQTAKVTEAEGAELWNPTQKEVRIELNPQKMAALQLFPRDVERAVLGSLSGFNGGSITVGTQRLSIQMPRASQSLNDLGSTTITSPSGRSVHLSDIAKIDFGPKTYSSRSFKTNGAPSLIFFASPKPGGNIKKMCEELMETVRKLMPTLPSDVQYKILVDPSQFINAAIHNVFHEVAIGALLAVAILFLFIGSFKNTITAAIEIPMSMVLAFILMRLSGMNLNLISLGGLALSAGMNVDASVVVMENIFRHVDEARGKIDLGDFSSKLKLISQAVAEVRFSVIASTLASLVVFAPLAFTSDLSYAILGDLAKTVVFSHGFSALVALVLVPTVRLHLMSKGSAAAAVEHSSPLDPQLRALENLYARLLGRFIAAPKVKLLTYGSLVVLLVSLLVGILPRLPKEVIGTPDTDWMVLSVNTQGNRLVRQMDSQMEEVESDLLREFGSRIQYTFTQIQAANQGWIMARMKNKADMRALWKDLEKRFTNTPFMRFWVGPWNPAELPIPNPPQLRLTVRGGGLQERADTAEEFSNLLEEKQILPRIWTDPAVGRNDCIVLKPNLEQWSALRASGGNLFPSDLADLARVVTSGRRIGRIAIHGVAGSNGTPTDLYLRYPDEMIRTPEELGALPLGIGSKLIPFRALSQVQIQPEPPTLYREDGRELFVILGRENESAEKSTDKSYLKKTQALVDDWNRTHSSTSSGTAPRIYLEDGEKDLTEALHQLAIAVALSVLLIFLTLLVQFGDFMNALLVLISVPLGFIGVLTSLFVFKSTLSLNSVLGIILLNGIAVANSIILVDFLKRLVDRGLSPAEAAIEAARKRLRPILITSLTTVLGMLPIAAGMGEGGRILQPLGIAVSGGLWVSMTLTLFIVPALQVSYLNWTQARKQKNPLQAALRDWTIADSESTASAHTLGLLLAVGLSFFLGMNRARAETRPLSFDQAVARILERSTDLAIAQAQLQGLQARHVPLKYSLAPEISLSAKQIGTGVSMDLPQTWNAQRQVEASAVFNLFRFGADSANERAALADELSQEARLDSTALKTEEQAIEALISEIQRKKEIAILQEMVRNENESVRIARERYQRGLLPLQEVEKISIDRDNAQAKLSDAMAREVGARQTLRALLGHDQVETEWPWKERLSNPKTALPCLENKAPEASTLPEVRAAAASRDAENERLSRSWRLMLPSLDASLSYGVYAPYPQNFTPQFNTAITLSVPLFDRLVGISGTRAQAKAQAAADLAVEQALRNTQAELEGASEAYRIAAASARSRETTLLTSRKLFEEAQARFRIGRISTNDLFVDQNRLFDSEFLAIQSWGSAHLAYARLCHSRGSRVTGP